MRPQHPRAGILRTVLLPHRPCPDASRGAELGDLLEELVVNVEEERQPGREVVNRQPARQRRLDVGEAVGQGERQLLCRGAAGLADVIAGDADRVPLGHLACAEFDGVGDQPHRGRGREEKLLLRDVLLQDVVLGGAAQRRPRDATPLGRGDIHRPDDRGRAVDGHGGRHLVQRDAFQQRLHVGQRRDRHPALAEFADRFRRVGIVAVEGGHVERDGEPGLPLRQQILEAGVGLLGRAEAGEHAHGPRLTAVAGGMDPAGEGVAPRQPQVAVVIQVGHVGRGVEPVHGRAGDGGEGVVAQGEAGSGLLNVRLLPSFNRLANALNRWFIVHGAPPCHSRPVGHGYT